ncbi:MAG: STAS domain-containing protein [Fimbriimonadaceae bacterium]|nr:STAS domain-containing protein [Fimbriimonadaceae bacterium]
MALTVAHPFQICVRALRRATLVEVLGTLDGPLLGDPEVAEVFTGAKVVVLDLTRVEAFDPRGLEALERVSAMADAAQVRLRVVSPRGSKLRRALDLLRFPSFVVVEDTVLRALRYGRP